MPWRPIATGARRYRRRGTTPLHPMPGAQRRGREQGHQAEPGGEEPPRAGVPEGKEHDACVEQRDRHGERCELHHGADLDRSDARRQGFFHVRQRVVAPADDRTDCRQQAGTPVQWPPHPGIGESRITGTGVLRADMDRHGFAC